MTSRRALAALVAALALLAATAAVAQAQPLLSAEDEIELAQRLADASADQGVCYSWSIDISGTGNTGIEEGSSIGPDDALDPNNPLCSKGFVSLTGFLYYSCGSCEAEDSASLDIQSSFGARAPSLSDIEALGYSTNDLLGDNDDVALFNMVSALPLLTAEKGLAEPVAKEDPAAGAVPAQDKATNPPGNDFLRGNWLGLLLFGLVFVSGPAYFFYRFGEVRKTRRRQELRNQMGNPPAYPPGAAQQPGPPPGAMRGGGHGAPPDRTQEDEIRRALGQNAPPQPPTREN